MIKTFFIQYLLISFCATAFAQRLVLPGDHPDPSVVKIGDTYWASATTSNWFPAYPILSSKDLVHWRQQGYIFNQLPAWADFYFWAPELSYENGKVYVYYAAHKKNGNLCVGVASADKPEGPYKDHGPLICQEVGSIDAFPMRDENGKLYLIWKEDANSVGKPTPIWAMQMNEERTALTGEKKELFRNNLPWEGNLVEGVSMVKHGDYFYAFYAAAGCCGAACSYTVGVARSKKLLGPWEKYQKDALLSNTDKWICPGHGTPVEKDGKYYFMYHGYNKSSSIFTGREGLLIEYKYTADGWIEFVTQNKAGDVTSPKKSIDRFNENILPDKWQWSVFQHPGHTIVNDDLQLPSLPNTISYIGQKVTAANYKATGIIDNERSTASAGIGIIGDEKNYVAAFYRNGKVSCVQVKDGKEQTLSEVPLRNKQKVYLTATVVNNKDIFFSYSYHGFKFMALNKQAIDGSYLPPWDRAVRAGLLSKGDKNTIAVFKKFKLVNR